MSAEQLAPYSWKPGQSGNPGGRPKSVYALAELARENTAEAIEKIVSIMRNGDSDTVQRKAAEILRDRGYGKAVQVIARPSDKPEEPQTIDTFELARRVAYLLAYADM